MSPLIFDPIIRIDSGPLAICSAALALGLLLTWLVAVPAIRARAYRRGADQAQPQLTRELALERGKLEASRLTMRELRLSLAEARATIATLRGLGADIARRASGLVTAVDEPTESEAQVLRIGRRR